MRTDMEPLEAALKVMLGAAEHWAPERRAEFMARKDALTAAGAEWTDMIIDGASIRVEPSHDMRRLWAEYGVVL